MQWNRKVFLAEIRWLKETEGVKTATREYSNAACATHKTVRTPFQSCVAWDRSPDTVVHMIISFHSEGKSKSCTSHSSDVAYTVTKRFECDWNTLSIEWSMWCWANRVELRTYRVYILLAIKWEKKVKRVFLSIAYDRELVRLSGHKNSHSHTYTNLTIRWFVKTVLRIECCLFDQYDLMTANIWSPFLVKVPRVMFAFRK